MELIEKTIEILETNTSFVEELTAGDPCHECRAYLETDTINRSGEPDDYEIYLQCWECYWNNRPVRACLKNILVIITLQCI